MQDRYQSRIMWLPALVAFLAIAAVAPRYRPALTVRAGNVFWSGFEAAASAMLSFASAFIVARLVGPAEVGIAAAVIAVHVLLWVAVNALFADPLVQRATLDEGTFSSALWASVAVGGVAAVLQVGAAHPIAWWLGDTRLIAMSILLAAPLPLVGAAGPIQGLLTRQRNYKALATRTTMGQGLGTICGVASALAGAGAWAIVLQQFVVSSAGAVALLVQSPARPHWSVRMQDLRDLLRIGLPLTASTFVQLGRYRLFALLIGGTAGAAALGQVHMAFRLVDTVRELVFTAQWRLMLPVMSERQDDLPALLASTDRCLAWSSLVAFPLCCAMALCVQPLVELLLGPVWQPAGFAALPLIGLSAWLFLAFPAGVAVIARGVPRYALIGNIAGTMATVFGVILLRPAEPMHAVLLWLGAQLVVSPYVLWTNARVLRTSPLRPLRAGLPLLAATGLGTIAAFMLPFAAGEPASPVSLIALRLLIAVIVGAPIALLLTVGLGRSVPSGPPPPGSGTLRTTGSDPRGPNAHLRL
jgi:O-antigen/teichoic acid export membrane protein